MKSLFGSFVLLMTVAAHANSQLDRLAQYKTYAEALRTKMMILHEKNEQLAIQPGCVPVAFDKAFESDFNQHNVRYFETRPSSSGQTYLKVDKCSGSGQNEKIIAGIIYSYEVESSAWAQLYKIEMEAASLKDAEVKQAYNIFVAAENAKIQELKKKIESLGEPYKATKEFVYGAMSSVGAFAAAGLWLAVAAGGILLLIGSGGTLTPIAIILAGALGMSYGSIKSYNKLEQMKMNEVAVQKMKGEIEARTRVLQASLRSSERLL